ncbi:MAG: hypothetical protein Q7R63_00480 [bacterium]|nr:hypothetical protein [bacterium]
MDMNMNQGGPHSDAEKSQAGTNLVIVLLVLVIVVAGVKLLMSSDEAIAPTEDTVAEATSTATAVAEADTEMPAVVMPKPAMPTGEVVSPVMLMGKGMAAFSVLSKDAVAVRAIYVHNPFRASEGDAAWVQIYDGYRAVPAGQSTLVFTVSLSAMTYDQVKVRTLNVSTGIPNEVVKMMPVAVSAGEKTLVTIEI